MDISKYNPQAASDTAKRLVVLDPYDSEPLKDEDGTEMAVHVVGMQSSIARNIDAKQRREMPQKEDDESDEAYHERVQSFARAAGAEKVAAMVTKLEGKWEYDGKQLKAANKEALAEMLSSQDWLANQIIGYSRTLANYRPKI